MKSFSLATLFLPAWALPWIGLIGVLALIVGARGLAGAAGMILVVELIVAPLMAPWLATLPTWVLLIMGAVMVLTVVHGVIDFLFGKEAAGHVSGTYLVRLLDLLLLGPFRLLGRLLHVRNE